jgi:7-cyano-7-deazaguanine synthase
MTVVLLSGGLDSAVCLAMQTGPVDCLTVDYGQRHRREIQAAADIAKMYGANHTIVTLNPELFAGSALTGAVEVPDGHAKAPDATYVPARNTVLLALAAARAESIGSRRVVIGANADDAAGYPDCRRKYLEAFRDVLQQGTVGHVWIQAPLLGMTKSEVRQMADELGVPVDWTWSCYAGGDTPCGVCGACQ